MRKTITILFYIERCKYFIHIKRLFRYFRHHLHVFLNGQVWDQIIELEDKSYTLLTVGCQRFFIAAVSEIMMVVSSSVSHMQILSG